MAEQTPLHELLDRQVSRKEFLATVGLGFVSLIGLSSIYRFLTGHGHGGNAAASKTSGGYGSSPYGE